MSTVQEISAAIQNLTRTQREQLIAELPKLLPELNGDAEWERIIRDPRPRPALTALLAQAEADFKRNPGAFRETCNSEFDRET